MPGSVCPQFMQDYSDEEAPWQGSTPVSTSNPVQSPAFSLISIPAS